MCFRVVFSREGPKVSDVRRRASSRAKNIDVSRPMLLLEVSEFRTSECLLRETIRLMKILGKELVQPVRTQGIFIP
jgi:hypothetical protein